jgi:hypothetical protein
MDTNAEFIVSLSKNLEHCEYWLNCQEAIKASGTKPEDVELEKLEWALDYFLNFQENSSETPYEPRIKSNEFAYPPEFSQLTEDNFLIWADLLKMFSGSILIRARIADLLWVNRFGNDSHKYALTAHSDYLEIATNFAWRNIYKSNILRRSMNLARELRIEALTEKSASAYLELISDSLSSNLNEPGVYLDLIEDLIDGKHEELYPSLESLVESAELLLKDDPFNLDILLEIKIRLSDRSEKQNPIMRQRMNSWEVAARKSSGLIKLLHFQKALELAERYSFKEDKPRILKKIEESGNETMSEMSPIMASVEIPQEKIAKYIDQFCSSDKFEINIALFASHCPIPSDLERRENEAKVLIADFPLQSLFAKTIMDSNGLPIRTVDSPEDHLEHRMIETDSLQIALWGDFSYQILSRILNSRQQVMQSLSEIISNCPFISDNDTDRILNTIDHFISGNYEESAHLLLPRIEKLLRQALQFLNKPTYRQPISNSSDGKQIQLAKILHEFKRLMPENIRIYLKNLLVETTSLNLRNLTLHGLKLEITKVEAALLIHATLMILHLSPKTSDEYVENQ